LRGDCADAGEFLRGVRGEIIAMEKRRIIQRISENVDGIGIIDYVEESKKAKLDSNFEELTGSDISMETKYYPWVVINSINPITKLTKAHNISSEFEFINVIWAKHIGVADEIICYGKICKESFEERVKGAFVKSSNDRIENAELTNYLNKRTKCLNELQIELEGYIENYVNGILLSQNRADLEPNEPKCISFWTYKLENEYNPLKVESSDTGAEKINKWIKEFDNNFPILFGDVHKDSDLSLLGRNPRITSFSLINKDFIIGHGDIKQDMMGWYTNRYIIFSLLPEKEEMCESGWSDPTRFQYFIVELSKILLSFHWIRYRFKELNKYDEKITNDTSELLKLDKKLHDKELEELSQNLEQFIKRYDEKKEENGQNLKRFSQIGDEIKYLKSLRGSISDFTDESTSFDSTKVSSTILKDTDFWFGKISGELEGVKSKEAEVLEYIHDMIDVSGSFINVKLQENINKLTTRMLYLTIVIVILTIITIRLSPDFNDFISTVKNYLMLILVYLMHGKL